MARRRSLRERLHRAEGIGWGQGRNAERGRRTTAEMQHVATRTCDRQAFLQRRFFGSHRHHRKMVPAGRSIVIQVKAYVAPFASVKRVTDAIGGHAGVSALAASAAEVMFATRITLTRRLTRRRRAPAIVKLAFGTSLLDAHGAKERAGQWSDDARRQCGGVGHSRTRSAA
jgi:hypothetical protein